MQVSYVEYIKLIGLNVCFNLEAELSILLMVTNNISKTCPVLDSDFSKFIFIWDNFNRSFPLLCCFGIINIDLLM